MGWKAGTAPEVSEEECSSLLDAVSTDQTDYFIKIANFYFTKLEQIPIFVNLTLQKTLHFEGLLLAYTQAIVLLSSKLANGDENIESILVFTTRDGPMPKGCQFIADHTGGAEILLKYLRPQMVRVLELQGINCGRDGGPLCADQEQLSSLLLGVNGPSRLEDNVVLSSASDVIRLLQCVVKCSAGLPKDDVLSGSALNVPGLVEQLSAFY